ncbi:LLM class flavin-dependent oxidoreductase [Alicyclobacillus tolerans]|uniref:LLM class flavin-dependent oxidoreductase n=1 Tax=Alicyclobacillus tolerans TaxID=90970 RepID=UPI001F2D2BF2|nr:LLM class flavin-dependent oxidoreductase [Alicyclobacillus tolerans]MCF8565087.1 LLM class flavin-dependent oxidoreductase [Alicyclobacillus tolerans]
MKFSIFDLLHWPYFEEKCEGPKQTQVYNDHLDEWVLAEELGFDEVWLSEHHFTDYNLMPSPNLMIASLAQRTKAIRLGIMINAVPFHDPVRLAEECAMLDILSNGRLDCGFGRSADFKEYDRFVMPPGEGRPRFQEGLELIKKLWTEDDVTFQGKFFRVENANLHPRPIQQPHPPIYTPVRSPETHAWAAQEGYPISSIFLPVDKTAESFQLYRSESEKWGRRVTGEDFLLVRHIHVAETAEQAYEEAALPMVHFFRLFREVALPNSLQALEALPDNFKTHRQFYRQFFGDLPSADDLIKGGQLIVGDPTTVRQEIQRQVEIIGTKHLMCCMSFGNLAHDKVVHSMKLFSEHVMPYFKSQD